MWKKDDKITRYLLQQCLPDSTVLGLNSCTSTAMCWSRVSTEYTAKSIYAQNDLEQTFLDMCCPRGGDVRPFLTSMRNKHEELAAAGIAITQKDYQHTMLKGIPEELAKFAAQLLSSVSINVRPIVDTNVLIDHICEESKRMKNRRGSAMQNQKGGAKKEGVDEDLAATGSTDQKVRKRESATTVASPAIGPRSATHPKRRQARQRCWRSHPPPRQKWRTSL